jgi:hypothetical protein
MLEIRTHFFYSRNANSKSSVGERPTETQSLALGCVVACSQLTLITSSIKLFERNRRLPAYGFA